MSPGAVLGDSWDDISPINSQAKERLGYPTQKPVALLERIISASSNPGDVVLDPFWGCGTATVAAQKLGRQWVGIDITYLAIAVMRQRLRDSFPELGEVEVINRPTEVAGARAMLAETCIVSVKRGNVNAGMVQGLKGAMETHGAKMGLFVTLEEPSGPMRQEAAEAGFYHSDVSGRDYPRLQIVTIRELLEEGRKPNLPLLVLPDYQKAPKVSKAAEQAEMFGG
jgi:site-specific DNA-methyltransferase (adenine-specific)